MKLADHVAQSHLPFVAQARGSGHTTVLNNTADCAHEVVRCPIRFVLTDDLTRLCTALAYSVGASALQCSDLLRIPATLLWLEWNNWPWESELARYGFAGDQNRAEKGGRRGALIRATPDGRRGTVRTFWSDYTGAEAFASSIEAYFDFDVSADEEPEAADGEQAPSLRVADHAHGEDVLSRCFRFRYERSWRQYYDRAAMSKAERDALDRHALGTSAIAMPVMMAFLLLLGTRGGLPRRTENFERLNRVREKSGKAQLLDHVEVSCPLLARSHMADMGGSMRARCTPRLHHVRGHLVRRGSELFWRVPHLRGSARTGVVRARTVTWTIDPVTSHVTP